MCGIACGGLHNAVWTETVKDVILAILGKDFYFFKAEKLEVILTHISPTSLMRNTF